MFTDAESTSAQESANATGWALRSNCYVTPREFLALRHSPYQRQVAPEVVERHCSTLAHDSKTAAPANLMSEAMNGLSVNESRFRLSTSSRREFKQLSAACLMTSLKELIGPGSPAPWFQQKSSQWDLSLIDCRSEFRSIISSETRKMFVQVARSQVLNEKRVSHDAERVREGFINEPRVVSSNFHPLHRQQCASTCHRRRADRLMNKFTSDRGWEALTGGGVAWNSRIRGNCAEKSTRENDVLRFSFSGDYSHIFSVFFLFPLVRGIHATLYFLRLTRPSADFWRVRHSPCCCPAHCVAGTRTRSCPRMRRRMFWVNLCGKLWSGRDPQAAALNWNTGWRIGQSRCWRLERVVRWTLSSPFLFVGVPVQLPSRLIHFQFFHSLADADKQSLGFRAIALFSQTLRASLVTEFAFHYVFGGRKLQSTQENCFKLLFWLRFFNLPSTLSAALNMVFYPQLPL